MDLHCSNPHRGTDALCSPTCGVTRSIAATATASSLRHSFVLCRAPARPRVCIAFCSGNSSISEERTSLIPEAIEQLESDIANGAVSLQSAAQENKRRKQAMELLGLQPFSAVVKDHDLQPLTRSKVKILQLNIGLFCNQACSHCHVDSSPKRTEMMDRRTAQRCLELLEKNMESITTLDITGGAPELNSQFRYLVSHARALGVDVMDRCNLTVLLEPGQEDLVDFLVSHGVHVVASLPCYSASNVDQQRGMGVFQRSIKGLQMLNAAGYGQEGSGLQLDLVYNPNGIFLAPAQPKLEAAYKEELMTNFGIKFNRLYALNNMPIKRYADYLTRQGKLREYMQLLLDSFNPAALSGVMCRDTVSVGWDGTLYDCDFNQQLGLGVAPGETRGQGNVRGRRLSVFDVETLDELTGRAVMVDSHCFGCTAGSGSSCQGATSA